MRKLLAVLLCLGLVGCAPLRPIPVEPTNKSYDFNVSKQKVFDAALLTAQELNLDVKVIERDSGFVRFDKATLSPAQLDQYCEYPWVDSNGKPAATFQRGEMSWPFSGRASITIVVTEHGSSSSVNVRTNLSYSGPGSFGSGDCNSKGVFEDEFISKLQEHLK